MIIHVYDPKVERCHPAARNTTKGHGSMSVVRIDKNNEHQFTISPLIIIINYA